MNSETKTLRSALLLTVAGFAFLPLSLFLMVGRASVIAGGTREVRAAATSDHWPIYPAFFSVVFLALAIATEMRLLASFSMLRKTGLFTIAALQSAMLAFGIFIIYLDYT